MLRESSEGLERFRTGATCGTGPPLRSLAGSPPHYYGSAITGFGDEEHPG